MGYAKKLWAENKSLEAFDYEVDKRINNKIPFGSGGEKEYIDSMQKLRDFIEKEDNLTVVQILSEALSNLLKSARNTWRGEWLGEGGEMTSFVQLKCKRCGYDWMPQQPQLPKVCPRCKNYKWRNH